MAQLKQKVNGMRYLSVMIFKGMPGDFSNDGVTSDTKDKIYLVPSEFGNITEEDIQCSPNHPVVLNVVKRKIAGDVYTSLKPAVIEGHSMFGGCFAWSNDSRFRKHISELPLPVHDRVE